MRSSRAFPLVVAAALLAACGDGGGGPSNSAPTAAFPAPTCTLLACSFAGTGTDPDGTIASYSWNFGDPTSGSNTAATANANHTFSASGTYTVTLSVTDNDGASDDATRQVTVSTTPNSAPTATFSFACTNLQCSFTDESSDVDGTIASRDWDFGDGQGSTSANPNHTYAAAGSYDVTLTVTDNLGAATTSPVQTVVVTAASGLQADFTVVCSSLDCTITNTTTGAGAGATWAWDFGNGTTSTDKDPAPVHYDVTEPTQFTIKLVVTDGGTSQASKTVRVVPAATLTCGDIACTLGIEEDATVVVTLTSRSCEAHGNTFVITAPAVDTLFTDGCYSPVAPDPGSSFALNNGAAYTAGTQLDAEVLTGVTGALNPKIRVTGDFQNGWTLEFDDGFVGPGEPDFNDLVITVVATPTGP